MRSPRCCTSTTAATRGEWIPNAFGGRENLEAIAFLRRMNELVFGEAGATSVAEEFTAWPMVSRPTYVGGLGFGFKWNMGWMHDTLRYMSLDPIHRKYHHNDLSFGLLYAFHENFVLPLSHDEMVHGKGSLIGKMSGDQWQRFATLRAYLTFMWTHPGKKLLFMGGEFAQEREWNHDIGLDWQLLGDPLHEGVRRLVRDLNHLYRGTPALHRLDCDPEGFHWIDVANAAESIISYLRRGRDPHEIAVVICNFIPVPRETYRIGVPQPGRYRERINTDAVEYGGGGVGNAGEVHADPYPMHGHPHSIRLNLPPLGALVFTPDCYSLISLMASPWKVWPGRPYPLGATWDGEGVNFATLFGACRKIELCLFDRSGNHEEARIVLPEYTDEVRHAYLPDARPNLLYGYRVYGPFDPSNGHRFIPKNLLIDPYADALHGAFAGATRSLVIGLAVRGRTCRLTGATMRARSRNAGLSNLPSPGARTAARRYLGKKQSSSSCRCAGSR